MSITEEVCGDTNEAYYLSPNRELTQAEQESVWKKPLSHKTSEEELRLCKEIKRNWHREEMKIANILLEGDAGSGKTQLAKALSANFRLPYTKVTCFADMDKSDIVGAILPVISANHIEKLAVMDQVAVKALYDSDGFHSFTEILMDVLGINQEQAALKMKQLIKMITDNASKDVVEYKFYPSEIVRAYQKGYLLEIQEPTVIRDAAVLMALNSALELDGSINLPTEILRRHQDFIAVITTNRGYAGCRSLNEALRDRIQHTEKMDLPTKEIMIERAIAKIGFSDVDTLEVLADTIILLDKTARANAIKGVAGMRSYFYWADAVAEGHSTRESLYHKVIYKITTDPDEIKILEEALITGGLHAKLEALEPDVKKNASSNIELTNAFIDMESEAFNPVSKHSKDQVINKKRPVSLEESLPEIIDEMMDMEKSTVEEYGAPRYHQGGPRSTTEVAKLDKRDFRKLLNKEAREVVGGSLHKDIKLIIHTPDYTLEHKQEYLKLSAELLPIVREIARKALPLLEFELTSEYAKNHFYGTSFQADRIALQDYRYFAKKRPPTEMPSLVVGLRVDESASMSAFGRLEAAKRAVIAVYEFCQMCDIPILIYGDTADISKQEQMSIFAYTDFDRKDPKDCYRLMGIKDRVNNRDGMALRIIAERLMHSSKKTKLLISISDGQPKAMPNYSGDFAIEDMQQTIAEYQRKGVTILASAIGQDKDAISEIYGKERYIDITNLNELPVKLVQIIARYL